MSNLDRYFQEDSDAFWYDSDGIKLSHSIHGKSYTRFNKAKSESKKNIVLPEKIIEYVNDFLNQLDINTVENPKEILEEISCSELNAKYSKDIIWMKFTTDGYLGVVAKSNDVNFQIPENKDDYDEKVGENWKYKTSGIIVHKLNKKWNENFVLVFPIKNNNSGYTTDQLENAIGQYLTKAKEVPILDYYSHVY